jgi:eukaryotic-like serine/threonine-protein kinase
LSLTPGTRLGHYEVIAAIGVGGMGEVYRARDSRLNRDVAIKVLPAAFALDADRLTRFRREAHMLAALNHPNVAAIYGLEETRGELALVLELVDGRTLAEIIAGGPVPPAEALAIARQITDALAAAHERGIIHRDLKPANIKVSAAGVVKVLDFGLARAADRDMTTRLVSPSGTAEIDATRAGVVVGTAAYMSPEQAQGLPVDQRTDIWAFGCVLFEMLTGARAFQGDTAADTIAAILNSAPPLRALPASTPAWVTRVLARCLEKDQTRRIADIREVRRIVDDALASRVRRRLALRTAAALGVTAAVVALATAYLTRSHRTAAVDRSEWVRLTNLDSVTQPALSADGRMLAFIRGTGTFTTTGQVYAKLLPGGEPVALTQDALTKMSPVFSPSGDRIAYTVVEGGRWDTWIVPALRGEARRWLPNASGLTWVRDRLLFSAIKTGRHMAIVTAAENGAEPRDVYVPAHPLGMAHRSSISPDGQSVLLVEMNDRGVWERCRLVPLAGNSPGHAVGPENARCTNAAWSPDGKWMFFSANAGDGFHIWRQRVGSSHPEQMSSGPTEEEGLAIDPGGESLITSVGLRQRSVWVRDASGERQVSLEGYAYWPLFSRDGRRVCYRVASSPSSGQAPSELWVADLISGRTERLLPGHLVTGYDLSPADQVIASVSEEDGKSRLWLSWIDQREPPKRIPSVEGNNPRFGANGELFFMAADGDARSLFRARGDGSGATKIGSMPSNVLGTVSPDGNWISAQAGPLMAAVSTTGAVQVPILAGVSRMRWSADGSRVFIAVQHEDSSAFGGGRTYVVPLKKGSALPPAPPGGFRSEADLAAVPGVEVLAYGDLAPGPSTGTYAFSRTTTTRNLYRIPLR